MTRLSSFYVYLSKVLNNRSGSAERHGLSKFANGSKLMCVLCLIRFVLFVVFWQRDGSSEGKCGWFGICCRMLRFLICRSRTPSDCGWSAGRWPVPARRLTSTGRLGSVRLWRPGYAGTRCCLMFCIWTSRRS